MDSSNSKSQYTVKVLSASCEDQPNCLPHCVEQDCSYLCRHMITCTCYDYQHGHLCKHTHKVHNFHWQQQHTSENELESDCPNATFPDAMPERLEIGVAPSKTTRDEAGTKSKFKSHACTMYLACVQMHAYAHAHTHTHTDVHTHTHTHTHTCDPTKWAGSGVISVHWHKFHQSGHVEHCITFRVL